MILDTVRNFGHERTGQRFIERLNSKGPRLAAVVDEVSEGFQAAPAEVLLALGDATTSGVRPTASTMVDGIRRFWPTLKYFTLFSAPPPPEPTLVPESGSITGHTRAAVTEELGIGLAVHMLRTHLPSWGELVDVDAHDLGGNPVTSSRRPDYLVIDEDQNVNAIVECKGSSGGAPASTREGLKQLARTTLAPGYTVTPGCRWVVLGAEVWKRTCELRPVAAELRDDGVLAAFIESETGNFQARAAAEWLPARVMQRLLYWAEGREEGTERSVENVAGVPTVGSWSEFAVTPGTTIRVFTGLVEDMYYRLADRRQQFEAVEHEPVDPATPVSERRFWSELRELRDEANEVVSRALSREAEGTQRPEDVPPDIEVTSEEEVRRNLIELTDGSVAVVGPSGLALRIDEPQVPG